MKYGNICSEALQTLRSEGSYKIANFYFCLTLCFVNLFYVDFLRYNNLLMALMVYRLIDAAIIGKKFS